jgi:hypothetical protein
MPAHRGHISKRIRKRTRKDGTKTVRTVWRARLPDPARLASASDKVEATFATKREAEDWLTYHGAAVQSGSFIDPRKAETPVREVADAWRETWNAKPLSPKTQLGNASILERHVLRRWGDVRVGAVSTAAVQKWITELAQTRHAETVHHCHTVLRGVMRTAVKHELIGRDPCTGVSCRASR